MSGRKKNKGEISNSPKRPNPRRYKAYTLKNQENRVPNENPRPRSSLDCRGNGACLKPDDLESFDEDRKHSKITCDYGCKPVACKYCGTLYAEWCIADKGGYCTLCSVFKTNGWPGPPLCPGCGHTVGIENLSRTFKYSQDAFKATMHPQCFLDLATKAASEVVNVPDVITREEARTREER